MTEFELNQLMDRASVGDAEAVITLVDYYLENNQKRKAKLESERLKYISHPLAYRKLASFALSGTFSEPDITKAKEYFSKAYELGDEASGYNLALLLIKENDHMSAIKYLSSGVSNNHIPSIKLLASLYTKGEGVMKDLNIAESLLNKAYELGDDSVITSLGKVAYQQENYDLAFSYFNSAVSHHDLDAMYYLGICYAKGFGVKQDLAKARFYYEMGANLNEPNCLYNLSIYYRNGIGVGQNEDLADTLLQQAIEHGFKK